MTKKSKKRRFSKTLRILGVLLLVAALGLTVFNIYQQMKSGALADAVLSQLIEQRTPVTQIEEWEKRDYELDMNIEMPTVTIDGETYIGSLSIPALDKELPVISEWSYPGLNTAPCRYDGSAYSKDLILAAHNYSTHFGDIKSLTKGDRILFTDMNSNVFEYKVEEIEILSGTEVEKMKSGEWDLTLFTCTLNGQARVTVRCKQID